MNIDEIKRRIKNREAGIPEPVIIQPQPLEYEYPEKNLPKPHEPISDAAKLTFFQDVESDSEDEPEPMSIVWTVPMTRDHPEISISKISSVINSINDPVYDWRRKTAKGRRSRFHFTDFLLNEIRTIYV